MIIEIHTDSRGTYGAPRIHAELQASGEPVGRKRGARLIREAGIKGVSRRPTSTTTVPSANNRTAPDLVDRDFEPDASNELWVATITYVATSEGYLYLAVVLDAFSRRVIGWAMGETPPHRTSSRYPCQRDEVRRQEMTKPAERTRRVCRSVSEV